VTARNYLPPATPWTLARCVDRTSTSVSFGRIRTDTATNALGRHPFGERRGVDAAWVHHGLSTDAAIGALDATFSSEWPGSDYASTHRMRDSRNGCESKDTVGNDANGSAPQRTAFPERGDLPM